MDPLGSSGSAFGLLGDQQPRDIAGDIRREQRRKQLKRAMWILLLALTLFALGVAVKLFADAKSRDREVIAAGEDFSRGVPDGLREAAARIEAELTEDPEDAELQAALALTRIQLFTEFGEGEEDAKAAFESVRDQGGYEAALARGLYAISQGQVAEARAAVDEAMGQAESRFAPGHHLWLRAMATIVEGGTPADELMAEVTKAAAEAENVALRRARVRLVFQSGQGDQALELLSEARRQDPEHVGLAADEVLYNAILGQRYGGVADIADQLSTKFQPAKRDLAHARLARAVVHVHSGEAEPARGLLRQAWPDLPVWEKPARTIALETALLAGDVELTREILSGGDIDEAEVGIYQAWLDLIDGDVMKSLAALAKLDQRHPKVALLQGLALVEQGRWPEAKDWLERADKMLPGRVDVEVARARVEAQIGDPEQALRKLEALSEEEPYAPRAWTGLGEAISAVHAAGKGRSIREAQRAFRKAVERETLPAEALMRLGELLDKQRSADGGSAAEALEAFERAVETNNHFPRYTARLGIYLAELGFWERAVEVLAPLPERPGIAWQEIIVLIRAQARFANAKGKPQPELESLFELAKELGAPPREINIERARVALYGDEGGAKRAVEILTPLIEADENEIEGRVLLARAMVKQFDREEAVRMLRRGIQGADRDARLFLEWASIESRSGTKRSASLRARAAWKDLLAEDQPPAVLLDAAYTLSRIYLRTDEKKYGLALGRELTERVPYRSEAWRLRAALQLRAGNTSDASRSAQRSVDLDDKNPLAHEVTGHCLLRFGHKDQARASYQKAVELAKGTPKEVALRENLRRL
jgi:tetratricopeptide (TPR) repeat protein